MTTTPDPPPFVYISALMRTGSTLVSEALSGLPYAFIFREPHLGKNSFKRKINDAEALASQGVDLRRFDRRHNRVAFLIRRLRRLGIATDYMVRAFKREIAGPLAARGIQVGVKEIRHLGWHHYVWHFPEMRVIMLGRDPRDIYLSVYERIVRGLVGRKVPPTPASLAAELTPEFQRQLAISRDRDTLKVTYESLCTDQRKLEAIRSFANSPLPNSGEIGQFVSRHPWRQNEARRHGGIVSSRSVNRWKNEEDAALLEAAQHFFDLMPEYSAFWGYSRSDGEPATGVATTT